MPIVNGYIFDENSKSYKDWQQSQQAETFDECIYFTNQM